MLLMQILWYSIVIGELYIDLNYSIQMIYWRYGNIFLDCSIEYIYRKREDKSDDLEAHRLGGKQR